MSSISSLGSASQSASAYFKKLFKSQNSSSSTSTSDASSIASLLVGQNGGGAHQSHGLYKKIEQQVTTALQNAQKSGTTQDPNETIENAIEGVLSQNSQNGSLSGAADDLSSLADPNTNLDSTDSSFLSALQGAGVNGSQFQSDLTSAFAEAQNGQINYTNAFKTPTLGSLLNTVG